MISLCITNSSNIQIIKSESYLSSSHSFGPEIFTCQLTLGVKGSQNEKLGRIKLWALRAPCCFGLWWAELCCGGLYRALLGYTGLFWALVRCTGLYWAVVGCDGLYCAVLGCINWDDFILNISYRTQVLSLATIVTIRLTAL